MNTEENSQEGRDLSRRDFLKASTAAAAATPFLAQNLLAQDQDAPSRGTLRIGLIGCGGRGTGAAANAMAADPNLKIVSLGDAFADRLKLSLDTLKAQKNIAEKIQVPEERCFVGLDAYKQVIGSGVDVVILATPPHFRPIHLKAAIDAGKHVFAEKPVAVDAPGVRSVLATCEEARKKKLSVVSGLCLRYDKGYRETIRRIHEGALGEIRTMQANDFRGTIWNKPRQPEWTEMEYQLRNWYYFTWLSGDFNVEQHVHMLDTCAWVMKEEPPVSAFGIGGRQVRTGKDYGNIYDHHSVIYEYANGVRLHAYCRQQGGGYSDISVNLAGSKGTAHIHQRGFEINTDKKWKYDGEMNDHYVTEHEELFAAIRSGKPINNGDYMAKSTMMAILGRMATYTGQKITWDQAMNSKEDLSPDRYDWDGTPPKSDIAIPGVTKFK